MRITSRKNDNIVHLKRLGADRSYRTETGLFYCDGEKLLIEAVKNGIGIDTVLTAQPLTVDLPAGARVFETDYSIIESVSPMKTPQKVVFSCKKPVPAPITAGGRYIVLEDMQDPGNVGTVLRTAGAFSMDAVILVGACADPCHPRTVRASMGAVFRVPFAELTVDDLRELKSKIGLRLIGAALSGDSRDIRETDLSGAAVVIGSEGHGLSPEMLDLCDEKMIIPMDERCESLNAAAAAAIVMWEAFR